MNLLVTGGAGYIGAHFCKLAAESGHRVTVFDNLSGGYRGAVRWGELIVGDLLDIDALERSFAARIGSATCAWLAAQVAGSRRNHRQCPSLGISARLRPSCSRQNWMC